MSATTEVKIPSPVWVWGLPLTPITFGETLELVDKLIQAGKPQYFITANLHYAMLTSQESRLKEVNDKAAFIVADGMPLVWASRWRSQRLPQRVAGADLVPALCEQAARRGQRVFFLGGAPGIADEAARRMGERCPGQQVAGVEVPPFRTLSAAEEQAMTDRIRAARPDLLFIAFGQPKGEIWMAEHYQQLGVPVSVQIGASLDFLAGKVQRSPRAIQRIGFEWAYRLSREPGRLTSRYARNAWFALRKLARDAITFRSNRR
jgi:N-acetylglucosaminyldiphosphoundecaprenol N-acetyl-beta-D-mannosaminyltransferase